jgi:hypothetical protein
MMPCKCKWGKNVIYWNDTNRKRWRILASLGSICVGSINDPVVADIADADVGTGVGAGTDVGANDAVGDIEVADTVGAVEANMPGVASIRAEATAVAVVAVAATPVALVVVAVEVVAATAIALAVVAAAAVADGSDADGVEITVFQRCPLLVR